MAYYMNAELRNQFAIILNRKRKSKRNKHIIEHN